MSYQIPLFNLNFDEKEESAVLEVLKSKWISSGPKCIELEKKFAEMLGAKYALAVSNCTAALHLAALCLGIGAGDEVIVPSLTFVATANAMRYTGAVPVFCDIIGPDNPYIDAREIETLITEKTKGICVMDYAGFPCDMDQIKEIAAKNNLFLIEDSCHGPMTEYKGKKLGTIGDVGCFSFFSNKNISTGEGGMLVTDNEAIYNRAKLLRAHGMTAVSYDRAKGHSTNYDVIDLGYNYRLDDIRASIGVVQLDKLLPDIEKRMQIRQKYIDNLCNEEDLIIPFKDFTGKTASYIFPVVLKKGSLERRNRIREYLAQRGIQTSVHYPPVHRFKIYEGYLRRALPQTEYVADNEFTLPMYGALTENEIIYICDTLKQGLKVIE